jgi:hypothetical protein
MRVRTCVTGFVLLGGIALVLAVMLTNREKVDPGLDELRNECIALRTQIDTCATTMAELQASVQQLRNARRDLPAGRPASGSNTVSSDLAWVRALSELSLAQSNTALVVERLLKSTSDVKTPETPEQAMKRRHALEASATEEQQRCDDMKQKVTELLFSLKVPDEVATTPTSKALEMPSLQAYWPYFEAKRELEPMQRILESLKARLAQERIHARLEAEGVRTQ